MPIPWTEVVTVDVQSYRYLNSVDAASIESGISRATKLRWLDCVLGFSQLEEAALESRGEIEYLSGYLTQSGLEIIPKLKHLRGLTVFCESSQVLNEILTFPSLKFLDICGWNGDLDPDAFFCDSTIRELRLPAMSSREFHVMTSHLEGLDSLSLKTPMNIAEIDSLGGLGLLQLQAPLDRIDNDSLRALSQLTTLRSLNIGWNKELWSPAVDPM